MYPILLRTVVGNFFNPFCDGDGVFSAIITPYHIFYIYFHLYTPRVFYKMDMVLGKAI